MRVLTRYVIKQHVAPFVFSMAAMTGFMLLNQIARRLPMLLGKGLPWHVIVEFFALTIPFVVVMTISMSVLIAVLHTFSRLGDDSEITAMRASGVPLGQIVRPVIVAASIVAVAAFLFGDQVLPRTNHRLAVLMRDIARTKPTFSLKEHAINEVQRGRVFLRAAHIDQSTYVMHDVTIYRHTPQNTTRTVYADSGRMALIPPNREDLQLVLFNGSVHELDRKDPGLFQRTLFEQYEIELDDIARGFAPSEVQASPGQREKGTCALEETVLQARRDQWLAARRAEAAERNGLRSLVGLPPVEPDTAVPRFRRSLYCRGLSAILPAELQAQEPPRRISTHADSLSPELRARLSHPATFAYVGGLGPRPRMNETRIQSDIAHRARVRAAQHLVEFHKKYSIPAACIVLVLVGIPVALRFPSGGLGLVFGAGIVIFAVYYVCLIAGESLADRLVISPFLAMWAPNILFAAIGVTALWLTGDQGVSVRGWGSASPYSLKPRVHPNT